MSAIVLLVGLLTFGIIVAAIGQPVLAARKKEQANVDPDVFSISEVEDHLLRLVASVRDLDFDFDTGKLVEADYVNQRKLLIGRGVSALIRLDEARQNEDELDYEIENLITAYRQNT